MRSTGQIISQTVQNLLADAVSEDREALVTKTPRQVYTQKLNELADFLHVSRPYMPRKIKAGTWSSEDLDRLAIWFNLLPMEFVPGPDDDWGLPSMTPRDDASTDVSAEGDNPESAPSGS